MCSYYWRAKFLSYAVLKANAKQTPELAIMVFSAVNERWYFIYCVKTGQNDSLPIYKRVKISSPRAQYCSLHF